MADLGRKFQTLQEQRILAFKELGISYIVVLTIVFSCLGMIYTYNYRMRRNVLGTNSTAALITIGRIYSKA